MIKESWQHRWLTLNCTTKELKPVHESVRHDLGYSLNCTTKELKQVWKSDHGSKRSLWIVPPRNWNMILRPLQGSWTNSELYHQGIETLYDFLKPLGFSSLNCTTKELKPSDSDSIFLTESLWIVPPRNWNPSWENTLFLQITLWIVPPRNWNSSQAYKAGSTQYSLNCTTKELKRIKPMVHKVGTGALNCTTKELKLGYCRACLNSPCLWIVPPRNWNYNIDPVALYGDISELYHQGIETTLTASLPLA